jgi:hypothetical protein
MQITLGQEFSRQLQAFEDELHRWSQEGKAELKKAHRRIGQRWKSGAQRRIPVDEGRAKNAVLTNTYQQASGTVVTETGGNVPYMVFLEFGTQYIAGGRVKALGFSPDISDAQAIKIWPAKNKDRIDPETGKELPGARRGREARERRGAPDEQMPWLRPAFVAIRNWAIGEISNALRPPGTAREGDVA